MVASSKALTSSLYYESNFNMTGRGGRGAGNSKGAKAVSSKRLTSASSTTTDVVESCLACNKHVDDSHDALQCDFCDRWGHVNCLQVSPEEYNVFSSGNHPFYCLNCNPVVKRYLRNESRIDALEKHFTDLHVSITTRLAAQDAKIASVSNRPNREGGNEDMNILIKDAVEIEGKKANAVLFGLDDAPVDLDAVRELIPEEGVEGLNRHDVLRVFRDGPQPPNGKPRFLKIICSNSQAKKTFIRHINNSRRNRVKHFLFLRSRPDLSFLQRQRSRELNIELKRRTDAGELNLYINYSQGIIIKSQFPNQRTVLPGNSD